MNLMQSFSFDVSGIFDFVSDVGKMFIAIYQSTTFTFTDSFGLNIHINLFAIVLALFLLDWFFDVIWGVD